MPEGSVYIGRVRASRIVRGTIPVKGDVAVVPPTPGSNPLLWGAGNELQWGAGNSLTWG